MDRSPPRLVTLIVLTALAVLTLNMFLPALPQMQAAFGVSEAVIGLAISAYMAVAAALQLVMGPLSDRFGRRPVILLMLAVYCIASVTCLLAADIGVFLVARVAQAVAVGGGILASAIVRDMYDGRRAAAKLSLIASAMAVAPMLAPMVGGILEAAFGWRSIFAAYSLMGLTLLLWCRYDLGETKARSTMAARGVGALLRSRLYWAYVGVQALGVGVFYVFLTGAPFVMAEVFGLGTAQTGIVLGTTTAGFLVGAGVGTRLIRHVSGQSLILGGRILPVVGIGLACLYFGTGGAALWPMIVATLSVGLGNGLSIPSAAAGALSVRPDLAGSASGVSGSAVLALGAALTWVATTLIEGNASPLVLLALMGAISIGALLAALAVRLWAGPERMGANAHE